MPVLKLSGESLRRYLAGLSALCLSLFVMLVTNAPAQHNISREFQIKAVFLYNFTEFVTWPHAAFDTLNSPLVIGVLGNDPFGPFLDEIVKEESRDGHALAVVRYKSPADITDCHVLYIAVETKQEMTNALAAVKAKPILTVSDMDGFARAGGMIRVYNEDGRIRLRINAAAVHESNLVISSKLLRLADVIPDKNN